MPSEPAVVMLHSYTSAFACEGYWRCRAGTHMLFFSPGTELFPSIIRVGVVTFIP